MNVYGEINQVRRAMGRRRDHVDRRQISKYRAAFDRRGGRASEPCHLSCGMCGALVPPPAADPLRGDAANHDPCPHCGNNAWIDLTEDEATRSLASVEAYEHQTVDRGRRIRHWMLRIGGAITMGLVCFFAATNSYSAIFSILTALVGVISVSYFLLGYGHATQVVQRSLPYRWALPLPPSATAAKGGARVEGPVNASDHQTLHAPFSGRPCLAYRVVVRRDGAPSNAVPALVTQRSCDLSVEGRPVPGSNVRLDLHTAPVAIDRSRETAATSYLRRHGILETEGSWILEEAVLEPGTRVVVTAAERRGAILEAA